MTYQQFQEFLELWTIRSQKLKAKFPKSQIVRKMENRRITLSEFERLQHRVSKIKP